MCNPLNPAQQTTPVVAECSFFPPEWPLSKYRHQRIGVFGSLNAAAAGRSGQNTAAFDCVYSSQHWSNATCQDLSGYYLLGRLRTSAIRKSCETCGHMSPGPLSNVVCGIVCQCILSVFTPVLRLGPQTGSIPWYDMLRYLPWKWSAFTYQSLSQWIKVRDGSDGLPPARFVNLTALWRSAAAKSLQVIFFSHYCSVPLRKKQEDV